MGARGRLLLGSVVLLAGCATTGGPAAPVGAPATPSAVSKAAGAAGGTAAAGAATGCNSRVETGSLPDWADAGFSGDARVPHVFGAQGEIVAVLFGYPLTHERRDGATNKILWVSRPGTTSSGTTSSATLVISARLDGTGTRETQEIPGPGPSIVDMPQPGCWHLELRWSGRVDTMDLVYAPAS